MSEDKRQDRIVDLDQTSLFVPFHLTLMDNEELTASEKMLYLVLKSYCINATSCYPSQSKIMKRAGIKSNKTLTTTLQSLENKGVILIAPEFDENNKRLSNTYYLAKFDANTGKFDADSLNHVRFRKEVGDNQAIQLKQKVKKCI